MLESGSTGFSDPMPLLTVIASGYYRPTDKVLAPRRAAGHYHTAQDYFSLGGHAAVTLGGGTRDSRKKGSRLLSRWPGVILKIGGFNPHSSARPVESPNVVRNIGINSFQDAPCLDTRIPLANRSPGFGRIGDQKI